MKVEALDVKGFLWETCSPTIDVTSLAEELCEGGADKCLMNLGQLSNKVRTPECRSVYRAQFRCGNGPVRVARVEEGEVENTIEGNWSLNCSETSDWWDSGDDSINYGITVVDATYGGECAANQFNRYYYAAARCNGKYECEFMLPEGKEDGQKSCAPNFSMTWYCGNEVEHRSLSLSGKDIEGLVSISCQ